MLDAASLRAAVARARELGAVARLATSATPSSAGTPRGTPSRSRRCSTRGSTDGDLDGILSVYSLSKQSNLAGYRAAFLAGDPALVERLLTARKHLGLMLPGARAGAR